MELYNSKLIILWSFFYNYFVKFNCKKNLNATSSVVTCYIQINVLKRYVIKNEHLHVDRTMIY